MTTAAKRIAWPAAGLVLLTALVLQMGLVGEGRAPGATAAASAAATAPPPAGRLIHAEGRVGAYPGARASVGAELGGVVREVLVTEKAAVKKGQALARLDATQIEAELGEARARLAEARARLAHDELELGRTARLAAGGAVTGATLDQARFAQEAAAARKAAAAAAIRRLEVLRDKLVIASPIAGTVVRRQVEPGETVAPGAALFELADLGRTRVEAEVDEFDAGRLAVGAPVEVRAEGFDGSWKGIVEEIPDGVSPRQLRPQDPGRPADTRVLLVKVALREPTPLKLGQRAEVAIASQPPAARRP